MDSLQLLPLKGDLTQPAPTLVPVETIPLKAQREAALMASTFTVGKGALLAREYPHRQRLKALLSRLAPSPHVAEETSDS